MKNLTLTLFSAFMALAMSAGGASAFEPKPTLLGFQPPASPNMVRLEHFHNDLLMWVITAITIFVLALLLWVVVRFNEKSNPVPSKTTHNVPLEILWTVVPVVILIIIAVPSFKLLYYLERTPTPDMTLKVSGYQWGWNYTYPDQGGIDFNSDFISDEEVDEYIPDQLGRRLLETYNPVVLPVGKTIQVIVTATDVLHSWTVPAFGAKKDAVPGRLNETWFKIDEPGVYSGQCSEICGKGHAFMPISVYAVTAPEFDAWTECVQTGAGAKADFPSRACVESLGFEKYRQHKMAQQTEVTTEEVTGDSE